MRLLVLVFLTVSSLVHAGPITIAQVGGFFHGNGGLISQLNDTSPSYFTTLDADNLGTFGWSFTNSSGLAITNGLFLVFLDADIDRDLNTFFNEYGALIALTLPPASPLGAIGASSWEIDEPGFVFGDILTNLLAGSLDNTNSVPSSAPDDPALALGFAIGTLLPNQTLSATFRISLTDIGGLQQNDPDSDYSFYFNGFAEVQDQPGGAVPEPGTLGLLAIGIMGLLIRRRAQRG